jgi:hypothetical protein
MHFDSQNLHSPHGGREMYILHSVISPTLLSSYITTSSHPPAYSSPHFQSITRHVSSSLDLLCQPNPPGFNSVRHVTYILTQPPESFTVTLTHDDRAHENFNRSDISKGDLSLNPSAVLFPTLYQMRSTKRFYNCEEEEKEARKE